jgi:hypothetical protein
MSELTPERLEAYADGELSPSARAEVEAALRGDPRAEATVAWWRGLRAACKRSLDAEPVPAALATRLQRHLAAQRVITRRRIIRLGVPGLAAAALFFAIWLWPRPAEGTQVDPRGFAMIHDQCAVHERHDTLGVRTMPPGTCVSRLKCKMPFACCVPNLATCGKYHADGGCTCSPASEMKVVHVYFRADEAPDVVISAFSIDRPIKLAPRNRSEFVTCGDRKIKVCDRAIGDVSMVIWKREQGSFVLAARLPEAQLRQLADRATLAQAERLLRERGVARELAAAQP